MQTLIEVARELSDIERTSVGSIMVTPGNNGYHVQFSIEVFLPLGQDLDLPKGVSVTGFEHYPDIERLIDWRTPAWDQVLELVNDPVLSRPEEFGRMEAAEKAIVSSAGEIASSEAQKHWVIVTHGAPRSVERKEWVARRMRCNA